MTNLNISIKVDNAAFTAEDEEDPGVLEMHDEVHFILGQINICDGETRGVLVDSNGNRVGGWVID